MPPSFAQSAHTLPRNFTFHYHDGPPPRTPEPVEREEQARASPPPPPREHREPYRLRRRRLPASSLQRSYRAIYPNDATDSFNESRDMPVPSIEVSDAPTGFHTVSNFAAESAGLHPVTALNARPFSPPKTPVGQIYGANDCAERDEVEDSSSQGESLTRPSTACSGFSDSSKSSSLESFPSLTGCGTSPESDAYGGSVFGFAEYKSNPISSPLQAYGQQALPSRSSQKQAWSEDMDDHLWITYMRYLQDPTHTPFKMLPGTAPPLGVCSRVVKEAKRTWKGPRTSNIHRAYRFARWGSNRANSPETEKQGTSGSATPVESDSRRAYAPWPRSDAATRKRLRDLCKRKPSLSAHYHRLMHTRSPSPFLPSIRSRSTSIAREVLSPPLPPAECNTFSTREMNISLATSISSTMQPGHPLNQLTSDAITPRPRAVTQYDLQSSRSPGHQKSQSVHLGFGIGESARLANSRTLASPFRPIAPAQPAQGGCHGFLQAAVSANVVPSLAPSVELHSPVPRRGFFKRPAQNDLDDVMSSEDPFTRQNHLMKELFGPVQPVDVGHRRVRSRGFSLGDMNGGSRLTGLFSPPSGPDQPSEPMQHGTTTTTSNSHLPPPTIDRIVRLGSPFAEKSTKAHFNTFPRNFSLSGLEPAMELHEDPPHPTFNAPNASTEN